MKSLQPFGVAVITMLAVATMSVAAVSAAPVFLLAEWLINGGPTTTSEPTDSEAELSLEETLDGIKIVALCSIILDGTVNDNGLGTINELLTLAGVLVSSDPLSGAGITCTNDQNCPGAALWIVDLPWIVSLELMEEEGSGFFALLLGSGGSGLPGYEIECAGANISDECTAEIANKATNEGANVDTLFEDAFNILVGHKLFNCTMALSEAGSISGLGTILLTGGGTLAVSSTG